MSELLLERLRANTRFLAQECLRRGITVELFDWGSQVLTARLGEHVEWIFGIDTCKTPLATAYLMDHKYVCKRVLEAAGLSVPTFERFTLDDPGRAMLFALEVGYPLVFKPCRGATGELVAVELDGFETLEDAIDRFHRATGSRMALGHGTREFLIEHQVDGEELRIFISHDGRYCALQNEWPHVIGDGRASIAELVRLENERRIERKSALRSIVFGAVALGFLARHGHSPADVPARGEKVHVSRTANIQQGATCVDCTDTLHPSLAEIAWRALEAFPGAPYTGLDVITKDHSTPQSADSYFILELNSNPSFGGHVNPSSGKRRNSLTPVVDALFPETAVGPERRLRPIVEEPPFA